MPGETRVTCKRCGGAALRESEFHQACREAGLVVDAQGRVALRIGGLAGPAVSVMETLGRQESQQKATFEAIENRKGFRCSGCRSVYCMDCLFRFAPSHPKGGKACPSCGAVFQVFT